jgi:hypothetical protein
MRAWPTDGLRRRHKHADASDLRRLLRPRRERPRGCRAAEQRDELAPLIKKLAGHEAVATGWRKANAYVRSGQHAKAAYWLSRTLAMLDRHQPPRRRSKYMETDYLLPLCSSWSSSGLPGAELSQRRLPPNFVPCSEKSDRLLGRSTNDPGERYGFGETRVATLIPRELARSSP